MGRGIANLSRRTAELIYSIQLLFLSVPCSSVAVLSGTELRFSIALHCMASLCIAFAVRYDTFPLLSIS